MLLLNVKEYCSYKSIYDASTGPQLQEEHQQFDILLSSEET